MTKPTKTPPKPTKATKPKGGRPPSPKPLAHTLHVRMEKHDLDAIDALAARVGMGSSLVTRLLLRMGLRIAERDPRELLAPSKE